jgi:hypothetical protein
LNKDELYQLYIEYGPDYLNTFTDVAQNKIAELATNFTAYQFFNDRSDISTFSFTAASKKLYFSFSFWYFVVVNDEGNDMLGGLQLTFSTYLHSTVEYFQLHTVSLPQQFEDAIQGQYYSFQFFFLFFSFSLSCYPFISLQLVTYLISYFSLLLDMIVLFSFC